MNQIGICGFGFVGQAVYNNLKIKQAVIYDPKYNDYKKRETLLYCDYIFVCVPTPLNEDGYLDSSYVNDTLEYLGDYNYNGTIILKSTIHPKYMKETSLNIVSNPEFLNEHSANVI